MLSEKTLSKIRGLNLDTTRYLMVCCIVQAAMQEGKKQKQQAVSMDLVLPGDWPHDYREQWWKIYPRREDKKKAIKALDKVAFSGTTKWAELVEGTEHYADFMKGKETRFIKLPTTFLNAESWRNRYNRNHERPASFYDAAQSFWEQAHGK